MNFRQPILLSADRFTNLQQTPWAGDQICRHLKDRIFPERIGNLVGESWEFSCDPNFPSLVPEFGIDLPTFINQNQALLLSTRLASAGKGCEVLLKTLNAASPLSLQVHPPDDYSELADDECGKPESWYVLAAKEGAGLYLGFKSAMKTEGLRALLQSGVDLEPYLQFVPVKAGDYFDLGPGVVHAVGAGVLLLEPQRQISGKSGKTYRLWDWGRKYNSEGREDLEGQGRTLHIEKALSLFDPTKQTGAEFINNLRKLPRVEKINGFKSSRFPDNGHYQLILVEQEQTETEEISNRPLSVILQDGYAAALVLNGKCKITSESRELEVTKGQPLFIPGACHKFNISSLEAQTKLAFIVPSGTLFQLGEIQP
ncbi:MAG: class I mannose-6-phosphate isomerase [Oligoflexales bacterium]|nr:class I mannose-6-phosphate isomerase [Oligoflexales bacterium]